MSRVDILGVPLDCLSMGGAVDRIRQYLAGDDFHLVVTLRAEMVMRAQEDREFFQAVQDASLVVPDSIGTVWAARRAGALLVHYSTDYVFAGDGLLRPLPGQPWQVGDRIVIVGHRVGEHERDGEILEVRGPDGAPPYVVRWGDDGHEGLFFPGSDARIVHYEHES